MLMTTRALPRGFQGLCQWQYIKFGSLHSRQIFNPLSSLFDLIKVLKTKLQINIHNVLSYVSNIQGKATCFLKQLKIHIKLQRNKKGVPTQKIHMQAVHTQEIGFFYFFFFFCFWERSQPVMFKAHSCFSRIILGSAGQGGVWGLYVSKNQTRVRFIHGKCLPALLPFHYLQPRKYIFK